MGRATTSFQTSIACKISAEVGLSAYARASGGLARVHPPPAAGSGRGGRGGAASRIAIRMRLAAPALAREAATVAPTGPPPTTVTSYQSLLGAPDMRRRGAHLKQHPCRTCRAAAVTNPLMVAGPSCPRRGHRRLDCRQLDGGVEGRLGKHDGGHAARKKACYVPRRMHARIYTYPQLSPGHRTDEHRSAQEGCRCCESHCTRLSARHARAAAASDPAGMQRGMRTAGGACPAMRARPSCLPSEVYEMLSWS